MTVRPSPRRTTLATELQFTVSLPLRLRLAWEEDLPALEWFGWFTPHREIIRAAYEAQLAGTMLMLVAARGGFPIAQAWIDLERKRADGAGVLWAIRVLPGLQGAGIGTRIIAASEQLLRDRGYAFAEVGVEPHNVGALRLYRRLGYVDHGVDSHDVRFTTPDDIPSVMHVDERLLRKRLGDEATVQPTDRRPWR